MTLMTSNIKIRWQWNVVTSYTHRSGKYSIEYSRMRSEQPGPSFLLISPINNIRSHVVVKFLPSDCLDAFAIQQMSCVRPLKITAIVLQEEQEHCQFINQSEILIQADINNFSPNSSYPRKKIFIFLIYIRAWKVNNYVTCSA